MVHVKAHTRSYPSNSRAGVKRKPKPPKKKRAKPKKERQYGCFRHHALRKKKVEKWGPREGWASFEQWPAPPQQPLKSDAEHSKASEAGCSNGQCKRPPTSNGKDDTAAQKRRRR